MVKHTRNSIIISVGAEYNEEVIPGLSQAGHNLYTLVVQQSIGSMENILGGKIVILTASPVYKCPTAPWKSALLIDYHLERLGIRKQSDIELHATEPAPMGQLDLMSQHQLNR